MQSLDSTGEIATKFMQTIDTSWWIEIHTTIPRCTYYFGPFANFSEASDARSGYVEDLESEGTQEIMVTVKRCQPQILTVYAPEEEG